MWFGAAAYTMKRDSHRTHSHCSHMSVETHIAHWYAVTFLDMHTHTQRKHTHTYTPIERVNDTAAAPQSIGMDADFGVRLTHTKH